MNSSCSLINPALSLAQDRLATAFESATEQLNLRGVFGREFDFEGAVNWLKIEAQQNFPNFPTIEIIASNQINHAKGAYAAQNNTIYLAAELVEQNQSNPEAVSQIILEEYGHYLDAWFNSSDTPGDEGELFAHYVQNQQLTAAEIARIKSEDDSATVTIAEGKVAIEQAAGENPAFDLIGLTRLRNDAQFRGIDGSGFSVAVIDTGLDTDHPLLADNYVAGYDFVDGDKDPSDRQGHGTHVAGTVGAVDESIGVAPDVGLISLRVGESRSVSSDKITDALEWVLDNQAEYNITAVNLSLGGGFFTSESNFSHSNSAEELNRLQSNIQNLEAAGVTVVASTGNSYFRNQDRYNQTNISFPAISSTIAVGAVWQNNIGRTVSWGDGSIDYTTGADRLPAFTQRLDADNVLFAPGAIITSTLPGGKTGENAGTSQAAPHVTGSVALLQEASLQFNDRLLTPAEVNRVLRNTADIIIDGDDEDDNVDNSNLAYLRINVYNAIAEIKRRAENNNGSSSDSYSYSEDRRYIANENANDAIADATTIALIDGSASEPIRETIGRDVTINRSNDVDLYNFQLESPGTVRIEVASDPVSTDDFDSYLRLFDDLGTEIAANDNINLSAGQTFSRLQIDLESGTYYVGVSGYRNTEYDPNVAGSGDPGSTGNYALKLSLNSEDDGVLLSDDEDLVNDRSRSPEDENQNDNIVYRFTHSNTGVNFYTASIRERDYVQNNLSEYTFQGENFESASVSTDSLSGAKPVYRFLNRSTGVHLFTISETEVNYITNNLDNYSAEGIAYYGYEDNQSGTVPLYRIHNSQTGTHLFTTSVTEHDRAMSIGDYEAEGNNGIAFYVEAIGNV